MNDEKLKKHIVEEMDSMRRWNPIALYRARIRCPHPTSTGDNPPHAKAKTQYETITDSFLCTMDQDEPIVAEVNDKELVLAGVATAAMTASQAAEEAQGSNEPPKSAHTYGRG